MAQATSVEPELLERNQLPVPARANELVLTEGEAAALQKVQARVLVAKKFPRNEDQCFQAVVRSCSRFNFAEKAEYRFKRGSKPDGKGGFTDNIVQGPSVYLAREMCRIWGNLDHGFDIISEDDDRVTIRGWAWDLQTNSEIHQDNTFRKVHQRYDKKAGQTIWKPITDDRDLRELKNRQGALAERNCMLALLPEDLKQDAVEKARETVTNKITEDPESHRKKILEGFLQVNVSAEQLEKFLGCKVAGASPAQLVELRSMWRAIADGVSVWTDYLPAETTEEGGQPMKSPKTREGMKNKLKKANAASDKKGKQKEQSQPPQGTDNKPAEGAAPPEPPPTPQDGDPASEGQLAIIKAMYETTIGLAEAGAAKLKEWKVEDPSELSYGGARDFITFLEATSKGGN